MTDEGNGRQPPLRRWADVSVSLLLEVAAVASAATVALVALRRLALAALLLVVAAGTLVVCLSYA